MQEECAPASKNNFLLFFTRGFEEKAKVVSPNPVGNQPINTSSFFHKLSFRTKRFKRKAYEALREESLS